MRFEVVLYYSMAISYNISSRVSSIRGGRWSNVLVCTLGRHLVTGEAARGGVFPHGPADFFMWNIKADTYSF